MAEKFRISEGLSEVERFPLKDLAKDPRNPRVGDRAAVRRSLEQFGQVVPVLIASGAEGLWVVGGNTTMDAISDLGGTELAGVLAPPGLSEVELRALALALNRTSDLASYDDEILTDILSELREADEELFAAAGYTQDDLEDLLALAVDEGRGNTLDDGKTPDEREDSYRDASTRAIMIPIPAGQYEQVIRSLSELRQKWDVETNAEVILRLLGEATDRTW